MSRNVSESISMMLATETVSLGELLDARMFLEVPLAGLAAANATEETAAALQAAIDEAAEPRAGDAAVQRRPTSASTRSSPRAAGNELLLAFTGWILEVLQPQLIAKISAARGRRRDPAPAPRHPARGAPPPVRGRGARDARAHRVPEGHSARRVAQRRELVRRRAPTRAPARRRAGRARTGTPSGDVDEPVLAVKQH